MSIYTGIEVGIPLTFTLKIKQGGTNTTIDDFYRMASLYMYKSGITQVGWTVTETWIPTVEQIGSEVYCAVATDRSYMIKINNKYS